MLRKKNALRRKKKALGKGKNLAASTSSGPRGGGGERLFPGETRGDGTCRVSTVKEKGPLRK